MASLHRKSRTRRHLTALDWPSTPEIDGYVWEPVPEPPSDADAAWAAANLGGDAADDGPPADDPIWDEWAEEHAARDRIERGLCL